MNHVNGTNATSDTTTRVAVVVAHPDDEVLWAGGLLLGHPEWSIFVMTLCRGEDPDRSERFRQSLSRLGACGAMGNLDDGVDQFPLSAARVQDAILTLLPRRDFDLLLTHAPQGEYTWHRRHGEVSMAVRDLWRDGHLQAKSLWQFAYEDGGGAYLPRAQSETSLQVPLTEAIWEQKRRLITDIYGFTETSWEARTTPHIEAFNCFTEPGALHPTTEQSLVVNS